MILYKEFFKDKPTDEQIFIDFGTRHNIRVKELLMNKTNMDEFLATIAELRFGVFFNSFFSKLEYGQKAFPNSSLTPDWVIHTESQSVVAEVFRINPAKGDQEKLEFGSKLTETLCRIQKDYYLQLKYDYSDILVQCIDFEHFYTKVSQWLNTDREVGEKCDVLGICLQVVSKNRGKQHVLPIGNISAIDFDFRRLSGQNSRLFSKLKYASHAWTNNMPFIICVHLSLESWFKPEDIYEHLYGVSGEFFHHEPIGEHYPGAPFHEISKGLYYSNATFKSQISGILVRYNSDYVFFLNYSNSNKMSRQFVDVLTPYLYKDLVM